MSDSCNFYKVIAAIVVLIVSVAGYVTYQENQEDQPQEWKDISVITVQENCSLDITLSDKDRFLGFLKKDIPSNSRKMMVVFFNNVKNPKCCKIERLDSGWLVEIKATKDNEPVVLLEVLGNNNSIWN